MNERNAMSNAVVDENVSLSSTPGKALNVALWVVQGLLALAFVGAASGKLLGKPEMVGLFEAIGVGQWFRYVTGFVELSGAALILVPKTRVIGAGLLAGTMLGAIATHLFVLHNAPTAPVVLLSLVSFVLWGRRAELATWLGRR
jgi:putative oxidoreductase